MKTQNYDLKITVKAGVIYEPESFTSRCHVRVCRTRHLRNRKIFHLFHFQKTPKYFIHKKFFVLSLREPKSILNDSCF